MSDRSLKALRDRFNQLYAVSQRGGPDADGGGTPIGEPEAPHVGTAGEGARDRPLPPPMRESAGLRTVGTPAGAETRAEKPTPLQPGVEEIPPEAEVAGRLLRVPIESPEGPLGVLEVDAPDDHAWTDDDRMLVEAVAQQLAGALLEARSREITEQALEEMRRADQLKSQFLANMSHDFRTPLNSIIGFSRVILKEIDGPINDTQRQDLQAIYESGMHLLSMVNDILDLTRIEAGRMNLTFAEMDLKQLVDSVVTTTSSLVGNKPLDLVVDIPDTLPQVHANRTRMRQVLLNLVSNAIKFTDDGYVMISARELADRDPAEVLVAVSDTGPGIPDEYQDRLFEPFTQIDSLTPTVPGGSGLGLSICRHLIELHGGRIWVESAPDEGSTFLFTLPVEHAAAQSGETRARLLIIDDQVGAAARYEELLGTEGLQVSAISDPEQAVEFTLRHKPHVLILDPLLPEDSSWQTLAALKRSGETREVLVTMCTLFPEEGGFSLGAIDFLSKPVDEGELLRNLRRWDLEDHDSAGVLVIGDQLDEMRRICTAIDTHGRARASLAETGGSALAKVHARLPDLIVLDLTMAAGHAFKTLRALKESNRTGKIPLLGLVPAQPSREELALLRQGAEYLRQHRKLSGEELAAELRFHLAGLTSRGEGVGETKPLPPFPG
jgi:signal transduction histidine kinase/DNA-binding response OmpR family regulator